MEDQGFPEFVQDEVNSQLTTLQAENPEEFKDLMTKGGQLTKLCKDGDLETFTSVFSEIPYEQ